MSGLKPKSLAQFHRSLHARGETIGTLAAAIHSGRSHLSQVLSGQRSGKPTWRKLKAAGVLTAAELELLGQGPASLDGGGAGASHGEGRATGTGSRALRAGVPRATISHMEHTQQEVA